ncbi:MAG: GTP cyclohydrolase [Bacteroidota bacterium]
MRINVLQNVKKYGLYTLLLSATLLSSCGDDEAPEPENEVEVITDVTLIFTNTADAADVVTARANDPDGEGVQELQILDEITLTSGVTYTLTYTITNALDPNDPEDIGAEILGEDDEHQFFFSFTTDAFTNPTGGGNIGATGDINYNDMDENSNPVGLNTTWTTGAAQMDAFFRVRLQHQPGVKTATTGSGDGDTDFDLNFVLNIE